MMAKYALLTIMVFAVTILFAWGLHEAARGEPSDEGPPVHVEPPAVPHHDDAAKAGPHRKMSPKVRRDPRNRNGRGARPELMVRRRRGPAVSDEEIMTFLKKHLPKLHTWLQKLKEEKPDQYERQMRWMRFDLHRLRRLQKEAPEVFKAEITSRKLRLKTLRLAEQLRKTEDPEKRKQLKNELKQHLGELFDAKMISMKAHIEKLEQQLKKLKGTMKERAELKDKIIKQRLEDLVTSEEKKKLLKWDF